MLLRVIDQRRRPCFVLTSLSFSNSTLILIYLELTVMNVIFAKFDSYYQTEHFQRTDIVVKLICDLIWT